MTHTVATAPVGAIGKTVTETMAEITVSFARWLMSRNRMHRPVRIAIAGESVSPNLAFKILTDRYLAGNGSRIGRAYYCSSAPLDSKNRPIRPFDGTLIFRRSSDGSGNHSVAFYSHDGIQGRSCHRKIIDAAAQAMLPNGQQISAMDDYASDLVSMICRKAPAVRAKQPLRGMTIVIDETNESGRFFANRVLRKLGADVVGAASADAVTCHLPPHENSQLIRRLRSHVAVFSADIAVAFDDTLTRAVLISPTGELIDGSRLVSLLSRIVLADNETSTIVTDPVTSIRVRDLIEKTNNGRQHCFKRGIPEMVSEAESLISLGLRTPLVANTSGLAAFEENGFDVDAAYMVSRVLVYMSATPHCSPLEAATGITRPVEPRKFQIGLPDLTGDPKSGTPSRSTSVPAAVRSLVDRNPLWTVVEPCYEGIRVSCREERCRGWFHFEFDDHDSECRITAESSRPGGVIGMIEKIEEGLQSCGFRTDRR